MLMNLMHVWPDLKFIWPIKKFGKNIVMCKKKKLEKLFEISFDLLFFLILTGSILSYVTS